MIRVSKNKEKESTIDIFKRYGFEYRQEFSENEILVFTKKSGFFDNASIVKFTTSINSETVITNLGSIGYSVKEHFFSTELELEFELFDGFFSIGRSKREFNNDYFKHIEKIIKAYTMELADYKYISAPYSKNLVKQDLIDSDDIIAAISKDLTSDGPRLILIEAAAGFGKTCTAYEIAKNISDNEKQRLVLFAELSKDRQAKIFSHVLNKEVMRSFPSLPSELVIKEIKNGRITVILDGFDELLKNHDEEKQFEKSQAMLETIGEILSSNAKVVLTTRKTAILQGDDFNNWIESHSQDFEFVRYSLHEPEIKQWLDASRLQQLEERGIRIKNISNPVLLTYLQFIPDELFQKTVQQPDLIIERYFNSMLEREIDRQALHMSIEDQKQLLAGLAIDMVDRNYTKDARENIVKHFLINEAKIIEEIRDSYPVTDRPTKDELANKFANHALLDRSANDDKIGFINDFVLGNFVSNNISNSDSQEWVGDDIFIESAILASSPRSNSFREDLWKKLHLVRASINDQDRIKFQALLLDRVDGEYKNSNINNMRFDSIELFITGTANSCVFYECTFKDCSINFEHIKNCTFVCCVFYDCSSINDLTTESNFFISCQQHGDTNLKIEKSEDVLPVVAGDDKVKVFILEKFWPIGKHSIAFAHRPLSMFFGNNTFPSADVEAAIDDMKRDGIILDAHRKSWIGIDTSHIAEITRILGRQG